MFRCSAEHALVLALASTLTLALVACGDDGLAGDVDAGSAADAASDAGRAPDAMPPGPPPGQVDRALVFPDGVPMAQAMAVAPDGSIVAAVKQRAPVTLGNLHADMLGNDAILVMKLTPSLEPVWMKSFACSGNVFVTSLALTPRGDVLLGGEYTGIFDLGPLPSDRGSTDLFVARLDGQSGAIGGFHTSGTPELDTVLAVASGGLADPEGVYVYGRVGADHSLEGGPAGALLTRYDASWTPVWSRRLPGLSPSYIGSMVLDPARGPIITGNFFAQLDLGEGQVVSAPGLEAVVAAFDVNGHVRYARKIHNDAVPSANRLLTVTAAGDVYVGSDTNGSAVHFDEQVSIANDGDPLGLGDLYLLHLDANGAAVAATPMRGRTSTFAEALAAGPDGAAYLAGTCEGVVEVQPQLTCASFGSVIVAQRADGSHAWGLAAAGSLIRSVAATAGHRLVVAGDTGDHATDLGSVLVPEHRAYIVSVVTE